MMLNGYTYSKHSPTRYWCSKKDKGCKARVKFDNQHRIRKAEIKHNHLPPRYIKTASGIYLKISS